MANKNPGRQTIPRGENLPDDWGKRALQSAGKRIVNALKTYQDV